ncbi:MAG: reverse transcriptase/maturase family protein [Selenomonadaceae bacterium]|nr:reverse transcriptase/maturase family protein [Selenomonadaceae bacterium]
MKRIDGLYEKIYDYENLYQAYIEARKLKRYRQEILRYSADIDTNLIEMQNELIWRTYRVGRYREFFVYDPKKRLIMALPFKDRIVQWAIYRQLNPILERRYISTSYGCRQKGAPVMGGPHNAVKKMQEYIRGQPRKAYILKMDISKYFYRVDHQILMDMLRATIKDEGLLWLLSVIIFSEHSFGVEITDHDYNGKRLHSVGMPIGNLSSQMFANFYLNAADQYAKHVLKAKHYLRYMDDMVIVSTDKRYLGECRDRMREFLLENLHLQLNNKTTIRTETQGVDFCGYRVWRDHIRLRKKSALKMKHRLRWLRKAYARGEPGVTIKSVRDTLMSYLGMLQHCDGYRLRESILRDLVLTRKGGERHEKSNFSSSDSTGNDRADGDVLGASGK